MSEIVGERYVNLKSANDVLTIKCKHKSSFSEIVNALSMFIRLFEVLFIRTEQF